MRKACDYDYAGRVTGTVTVAITEAFTEPQPGAITITEAFANYGTNTGAAPGD